MLSNAETQYVKELKNESMNNNYENVLNFRIREKIANFKKEISFLMKKKEFQKELLELKTEIDKLVLENIPELKKKNARLDELFEVNRFHQLFTHLEYDKKGELNDIEGGINHNNTPEVISYINFNEKTTWNKLTKYLFEEDRAFWLGL